MDRLLLSTFTIAGLWLVTHVLSSLHSVVYPPEAPRNVSEGIV